VQRILLQVFLFWNIPFGIISDVVIRFSIDSSSADWYVKCAEQFAVSIKVYNPLINDFTLLAKEPDHQRWGFSPLFSQACFVHLQVE
jgi:hypothetical protein